MKLIIPARFVPEKGHRYFLEAMKILRGRGVEPKAILIGDGPLFDEVRMQTLSLGLGDLIQVRPAVAHEDLLKLVRDADVLVMPSVQEGMAVAVLEAMALWKPTIVSAVGGLVDLVHDGKTGLLVPPANAVALAAAIERMIRNPEERATFGAAAASRARSQYTSDAVATQWAVLYRSLVRM